jgi:hypothetical protein
MTSRKWLAIVLAVPAAGSASIEIKQAVVHREG